MSKMRLYREIRGYTQDELAKKIGVGKSLISSYESSNSAQKPTLENALLIALALECRLSDVLPDWDLPMEVPMLDLLDCYPALAKENKRRILELVRPHVKKR